MPTVVGPSDYVKHVFEVHIRVYQTSKGLRKREATVYYQGKVVETRIAGA